MKILRWRREGVSVEPNCQEPKGLQGKVDAGLCGDHNYSVLVCPYFQYPKKTSQIYGQAIDDNVCLLSWEHLLFFIRAGVRESATLSLACVLWSISEQCRESESKPEEPKGQFPSAWERADLRTPVAYLRQVEGRIAEV